MEEEKSLQQMYPRRIDIPILIFISTGLLLVGLLLPLMHVEKMLFWKNEYSVLTGIAGLFDEREYFLAGLLLFFSVIFPIVKVAGLWVLWSMRFQIDQRRRFLEWLGFLGKWSMLDVFVVAILIVALKLGPLASVEPRAGVYVFCAAIMSAIFTTLWVEQLAKREKK